MLTSISIRRRMFPHGFGPHASRARVGGRPLPGTTGGPGGRGGLDLRGPGPCGQRLRTTPCRARGRGRRSRRGHDVESPRVRGRRARGEQARCGRRAAEPGVEVPRGGARRRADRAEPRGRGRAGCGVAVRGPGHGTGLRPRRRPGVRRTGAELLRFCAGDNRAGERRRRAGLQLRDDRPTEGGAPHAPVASAGAPSTGSPRSAWVTTTGSRWRPRPRTSWVS